MQEEIKIPRRRVIEGLGISVAALMTTPSFGNNISASGNDVEDPVKNIRRLRLLSNRNRGRDYPAR